MSQTALAAAALSRQLAGTAREDFRTLPLHRLRTHETLQFPLYDQNGILLLAEGSLITGRIIEAIQQRDISKVLVHREEPAAAWLFPAPGAATRGEPFRVGIKVPLFTQCTRRMDRELAFRVGEAQERRDPPLLAELPRYGATDYDDALARQLLRSHEHFVSDIRSVLISLVSSEGAGERRVGGILETYLDLLLRDLDLFSAVAVAPYSSHYPQRHSLHVAMLSLAIGVRAGLSEDQLRSLALGAILHDLGMLRVPKNLWGQKRPLTPAQFADVMKHPIHSVEAIEGASGLSDDVRYICYQMHERAGGQGYPRRTPSPHIHPLSKIAGIADAYVALVSERPHRPAMLPYAAMETILRQVRSGWFDPETGRLLLETLSLFPVGSYVLLGDGRLAKVIRSNGPVYHRPVVRAWPRRTRPDDETGEIIDLLVNPEITVAEAIPAPPLE